MRLASHLKRGITFAILLATWMHLFLEPKCSAVNSPAFDLEHEIDGDGGCRFPNSDWNCEICGTFSKPAPEFELAGRKLEKQVQLHVFSENSDNPFSIVTASKVHALSLKVILRETRSSPSGGPNAPPILPL